MSILAYRLLATQDNFLKVQKRQTADKQHCLTLLEIFWSDIVPCSWYCFFVYLECISPCFSGKVLPQDKGFERHSFLSIWMSTSHSWHRCSSGLQFSLVTSKLQVCSTYEIFEKEKKITALSFLMYKECLNLGYCHVNLVILSCFGSTLLLLRNRTCHFHEV